jgi:hypothetical protein
VGQGAHLCVPSAGGFQGMCWTEETTGKGLKTRHGLLIKD